MAENRLRFLLVESNMNKNLTFCILTLLWLPLACSGQSNVTVKPGLWRAVIKNSGGELPFGLDIQPTSNPSAGANTYTVYAINGDERLQLDPATVQGDTIRIPMALFDAELVANVSGNTLRGYWKRRRIGQQFQTLPFDAQYGLNYRFTPTGEQSKTMLSGKWATTFRSADGKDSSAAVGVFSQHGNRVTGTFLTPTGDYRYLAGNVVGDSLLLSCFDGTHLFLFKAKHNSATKTLTGGFWSGVTGYESWTARLDPKAELPDPASLTYIRPNEKFAFAFPEPNGQKISLNDDRFKGKVTVIQILGSWCPNCMDETNFLSPWYKRNRQRGVEVVGLAFEKTTDMAESGPKIQRMKERFKIDYPVVLAGTNNKDEASKALPALNRVVAFPTTIFVDKKGNVRHIYTGFSGPGTGKYYDQYVESFNRLVDKLLAE